MFDKFKSFTSGLFRGKATTATSSDATELAPNTYIDSAYLTAAYRTGSYDNNFPAISRIAETFAEVEPFAIDANGNKLRQQPRLIEVLKAPNEQMSGADFAEALITMMLVHPIVYVLVWHERGGELIPGGDGLTPDNVAGFTFLEQASAVRTNGAVYYRTPDGRTWSRQDVLTFSLNINPYSILSGYSPTISAKTWSTVDDYVADYQAGYFKNGAIPAGQMVITAPTKEAFNSIVDKLQAQHRGASNANNLVYVHRPTSQVDGKPMEASVEWVPFTSSEKDSTLQSIFDQANKKIETTFGVPAEVKGYLQNSNYASVETANYIFERYVVYPKLAKVWSRFTHELNRVTGGLGYSISFDYDLPVLTDTLTSQVDALSTLLSQGYTVESSVKALNLPLSFLALEKEEAETEVEEVVATEVEDIEQEATAGTAEDTTETVVEEVAEPTAEKSAKAKAVDETGTETPTVDPELQSIIQTYTSAIISEVIRRYLRGEELTEASLREWLLASGQKDTTVELALTILLAIMQTNGQEALNNFVAQLGLGPATFTVDAETEASLRARIDELIMNYGEQTIAEALARLETVRANPEATADAVRAYLQEQVLLDAYRVDRWAESEQHSAEETAVIVAAVIAAQQAGMVAYKTWRINPASPDICAECIAMNGQTVPLDQPFSNGNDVPHYHPHCYCTMSVTFHPPAKSVKITCPKCGRYMCESASASLKGIICSNSKCKRKWDIEVAGGKIKATEVAKAKTAK